MEPWGTLALTGCSYEDFPSRTTRSRPLLRKGEKAKYPTLNSIRLKFVKKTRHSNPSKAFDISIAAARVAPNLLKALTILSDTAVRRSAVDREDLKPYWKSEKKTTFL